MAQKIDSVKVKKVTGTPKKSSSQNRDHHDHFAMGLFVGICLSLLLVSIGFALVVQSAIFSSYINNVQSIDRPRSVLNENVNASANENANTNTAATTPVTTGAVSQDTAVLQAAQQAANNGETAWRLDPLLTASKDGEQYGLSPEDTYALMSKTDQGEGSGTGEAVVQVMHGDTTYEVLLIQPVDQGEKGIWAINTITQK